MSGRGVPRARIAILAAAVGALAGLGAVALGVGGSDGGGSSGGGSDRSDRSAAIADGSDGSGSDGSAGEDGEDGWHGALLTRPEPRPSFTLTDTSGAPYDFARQTAGKLTLLFFGYTNCPDVCPLHMATLSQALDRPDMPEPTVVFVTTDPDRDTPDRLRQWLDGFGDGYIGLTGTPDEIAAAESAAGVEGSFPIDAAGSPATTTGPGNYEVGHAAQIIAYGPDDVARLVYPFGVQRDDWVADLPRLAAGDGPPAPT